MEKLQFENKINLICWKFIKRSDKKKENQQIF